MSCQTGPQNSKLYNGEEDSKKVVKIDFNKVGHLDLAVLCSICHEEVHISQLFHHKKPHQAQAVLDYQRPWVKPIDMNKIALQRKQLILRTSMAKYPEREREKIDCAVDLLKESLKIAPYFCIKSVAQSSVHIKEVSNPLIKAVAICQDKNAIWNPDLEDVFVVLDNYGNKKGTCFLGVFDGNNGISAAQTTSAELPLLFLDQLSHGDLSYQMSQAEKEVLDSFRTVFRADYKVREKMFTFKRVHGKKLKRSKYEWIHRAYAKSFWRMDKLLQLGRNEVSRVCWSSCSAAICLVETLRNEKQDQEGEKTPEKIGNEKNQSDIPQEGQELPERIRAKKKSSLEHKAGSIPEEQREDPFESINDEKEQTIIQQRGEPLESINEEKECHVIQQRKEALETVNDEEQHSIQQREESLETINDEAEQNIIQLRGEPLENINDEKECHVIQQREEALETINDEEQHSIQQREESLETINDEAEQNITQQRGEPLENINDEKEWTVIQQREEALETINDEEQHSIQQREESLETINDEAEQNITQQRGEPLENINDEKEWTVIQQTEEALETINDEKEQNILQQREPLETISDGKEQNCIPQEEKELPERISRAKDKRVMGPETHSIMEQQLEEPFERINDGKEKNTDDNEPGDNEQMANNKDGIKEENLLENNHSSDEVSVGLMHIANIGNVHAVLCKNGKSYWLTKEHSTYCREEKIRVFRSGGRISSNEPKGLIEGLIKNTRGLGHHGNLKLKKTVIPVPHTISFPVDDSCQFLILASNGLWEVLDTSEVVLLTLTMFSAYLEKYQVLQLKKNLISKSPKLGKLEDEFYSWYLNQDFFPETDQNLNQSNSQLRLATNSANEKEIVKSDSFKENTEQVSENSLEPSFSQYTPSSEDSEIHPPRSGTEESPKENLDESAEEPVPASPDSSETLEDTKTFYALAAKYISKHLVKAALKAGSRDNITVLVALLNGCDKIPTYI